MSLVILFFFFFFFKAEDGIRDVAVTGVQTCALPIPPAANVVFASPDNLYWGPDRLGHLYGFDDEVRNRIRATPETTPEECGVNLHLLGLQPGHGGGRSPVHGLELRSGPDLTAV